MRKLILTILLFAVLLNYCELKSQDQAPTLKDKLKEQLMFLSADEMEGRFPATDANYKAAEYIISQLKANGLKAAFDDYKQNFQYTSDIEMGKNNQMEFKILIEKPGVPKEMLKPSVKKWDLLTDWKPMRFSENGKVEGALVFAGYGVTTSDKSYDDYAGIDVKGKIVIVLSDSAEGKPIDKFFTAYSDLRLKAMNAREHGAVGIIFVKTLSDSANNYYAFKVEQMMKNSGIVAVQANRTSISKFFPKDKPFLKQEQDINKTHSPASLAIPNTSVAINVEINEIKKDIPNVVVYVKGTDPQLSESCIVIGAHFDHLGYGDNLYPPRNKKPEVYNGADDNASGVTAVMELAGRINKNPMKKSLIAVLFNGEEQGLKGSYYYTQHPKFTAEKTDMMLNFDMVGRMKDDKFFVLGSGTSSYYPKLIDSVASADSVEVSKLAEGFAPSDNSSFYAMGIPSMMIFSGVHTDYHKPSDDESKINYNGMLKIIDYSEHLLRIVGNSANKPDYQKVAGDEPSAYRKSETRSTWFGIVPNFEENPDGFKISGTSAGSPAEKAGLQKDDVILKFGDKSIKNIRDLNFSVKEHKPGDVVDVVVKRGSKEMKMKVTLGQR